MKIRSVVVHLVVLLKGGLGGMGTGDLLWEIGAVWRLSEFGFLVDESSPPASRDCLAISLSPKATA
jgi:hypothetical protein